MDRCLVTGFVHAPPDDRLFGHTAPKNAVISLIEIGSRKRFVNYIAGQSISMARYCGRKQEPTGLRCRWFRYGVRVAMVEWISKLHLTHLQKSLYRSHCFVMNDAF